MANINALAEADAFMEAIGSLPESDCTRLSVVPPKQLVLAADDLRSGVVALLL